MVYGGLWGWDAFHFVVVVLSAEKTFLLELRDQAKLTSDEVLRGALYDSANFLDHALKETYLFPSTTNMQWLNCAWSRADLILRGARDANQPSPSGGAMAVPKELPEAPFETQTKAA